MQVRNAVRVKSPGLWLRKTPLRRRTALFGAFTGALTALLLAALTYSLTRSYMLEQREEVAANQVFANAQIFRGGIIQSRANVSTLVSQVRTETDGYAVVHLGAENAFYAQAPLRFNQQDLPRDFRERVLKGDSGSQRFTFDDQPYVVYGISIDGADAHYFEALPQQELETTLQNIATTLAIGVVATAALAGLFAAWSTRRSLAPLRRMVEAAESLASGDMGKRLPEETDPDLESLVRSFNEMAEAVQDRLMREQRFTSDVSHELRSPITALRAAVDVLESRRDELPERSRQALDVVIGQIRRFDQMVLDLLELSRLDAGAGEMRIEDVHPVDTVRRIASRYGFGSVPVTHHCENEIVATDPQRLERIVSNLLINARDHAGGPNEIQVSLTHSGYRISVSDSGPGVTASERERIFERFARGSASRSRVGTGLGLALVAEHARALGGRAWVEARDEGGAIFIVEFPTKVTETS